MAITWYGGSDTSFAENRGVALGSVSSSAYADREKTQQLVNLRDAAGNPTEIVRTADNGHYDFGVDDFTGTVYLDFGLGPYAVAPRELAERVIAAEAALEAMSAQIAALVSAPAAVTFADAAPWAPNTAYAAGTFRREPDKSLRIVDAAYTSSDTYNVSDTSHSAKILDPFLTTAEAALAFAPIGQQMAEQVFYAGEDLSTAMNLDPNGLEMQGAGTATGILVEADSPPDGPVTVGVYLFRPGSGITCAGVLTVPANQITPAAPLYLGTATHAATTTLGSPTVTDASITTAHKGLPVSGAGIPAKSFVGTVSAGSFLLSSDPLTQVNVNATAAGSTTLSIAPAVTWQAHDRWLAYLLKNAGTANKGTGLKVRIAQGATTFLIPAAPLAPTNFTVVTTASSAVLNWTGGVGATEHEVYKDGQVIGRGFNLTSFTDTNVTQGIAAGYKVLPRVPGAVGPFSNTITVAPSAVWSLMPQGGALPAVPDPALLEVERGTNTTATAAQIATVNGHQIFSLRGGVSATDTATTNNPQDRVKLKAIRDLTPRRAWGWRGLLTPLNASAILELYLGAAGAFSLTAGSTDFLRASILPSGTSLEGKAASYDPAGEGNTGAVGSFQQFTNTNYATNILTGAARSAGGLIPWGPVLANGTYYGIEILAAAVSGGRQLVTVSFGTEAQYGTDGAGLPVLYTALLTARFVAARAAGLFYAQELGKQSAPTAVEGWDFKDYFDIMPIAA